MQPPRRSEMEQKDNDIETSLMVVESEILVTSLDTRILANTRKLITSRINVSTFIELQFQAS